MPTETKEDGNCKRPKYVSGDFSQCLQNLKNCTFSHHKIFKKPYPLCIYMGIRNLCT